MLDSDEQLRASILREADAAASAFAAKPIDEDAGGIPAPPTIKVSEVAAEPIKLDFLGFGTQGSRAQQSGRGSGPPPDPVAPTGACCVSGVCFVMSEANCLTFGGTYQGDDSPCSPDPC